MLLRRMCCTRLYDRTRVSIIPRYGVCSVAGGPWLGRPYQEQQAGARLPEPASGALQAAAPAELHQHLSWPFSHGAALPADMIVSLRTAVSCSDSFFVGRSAAHNGNFVPERTRVDRTFYVSTSIVIRDCQRWHR